VCPVLTSSTKPASRATKKAALKGTTSKLAPSLIKANFKHINEAAFAADEGEDQRARRRAHKVRRPPTRRQVAAARAETKIPLLLYGRREIVRPPGSRIPQFG
jgi:hypothetical protein